MTRLTRGNRSFASTAKNLWTCFDGTSRHLCSHPQLVKLSHEWKGSNTVRTRTCSSSPSLYTRNPTSQEKTITSWSKPHITFQGLWGGSPAHVRRVGEPLYRRHSATTGVGCTRLFWCCRGCSRPARQKAAAVTECIRRTNSMSLVMPWCTTGPPVHQESCHGTTRHKLCITLPTPVDAALLRTPR